MANTEKLIQDFRRRESTVSAESIRDVLSLIERAKDYVLPGFCPAYTNRLCNTQNNPDCPGCTRRKIDVAKYRLLIRSCYPDAKDLKTEEELGSSRIGDGVVINSVRAGVSSIPYIGDIYLAHGFMPDIDAVNCTIIYDSRFDDSMNLYSGKENSDDRRQWHNIGQALRGVGLNGIPRVPGEMNLPEYKTPGIVGDLRKNTNHANCSNVYREQKHQWFRRRK